MNHKIKLTLLSLSAGALLAACGNGGTEDTGTTTEEPQQEVPAQPEEQTTDDTQEPDLQEQEDATNPVQDESVQTDESGEPVDDAASDNQNGQTGDSQGIENQEFSVSLDDAIQTFREEAGDENVQIEEIDFDDEDNGEYVYEFQGYLNNTEYDVDVHAETGEVVQSESDDDDDGDDEFLDLEGIISPQEAMQAALDASGSGYVDGWTLEVEDGRTVYDVSVENGDDQDIDAQTGDPV